LISLDVWIIIRLFQNQVYRRDAEIAEGGLFYGESREIPILHKPQAFGQHLPRKGLKAFCLFRFNRNKQKMIFSAPSASLR